MSDEQSNHPLYSKTKGGHPLSDRPPEKQKQPEGRSIPIPLATTLPIVSYALIAINVAIFVVRYIAPDLAMQLLVNGAIIPEAITESQQVYRLFTAMFLHLNEAHILFNSIAIYYIGSNLERLFGSVRFLTIYLLGGLAGSLLPVFFNSGGIGASGAVFAVWGAEVVFMYQHRQLFGAAGRARLQNSLMLMVFNFVFGFTANALATVSDSGIRISNAAHFGGLIGGVVLTWFIGPRLLLKRKPTVANAEELPVEIVRTNDLMQRLPDILYFCVGLVALLLIAIFLN